MRYTYIQRGVPGKYSMRTARDRAEALKQIPWSCCLKACAGGWVAWEKGGRHGKGKQISCRVV